MGRWRDQAGAADETDFAPEEEFRRLRSLCMASDPGTPAAALSATILQRANAIQRAADPPARQLASLWAVIDELGCRPAAEAHINNWRNHLRRRQAASDLRMRVRQERTSP